MKGGKVVASIVNPDVKLFSACGGVGPRKKRRRSGWELKGRRAIVVRVSGMRVAFVRQRSTLIAAFIGGDEFVARHLRARGLDRSALIVLGEFAAMGEIPARLLGDIPPGFRFRSERA